MERDEITQNYLRQADEAEAWANRTEEPLLQARWRSLAKEYRDLAQSRVTLLETRDIGVTVIAVAGSGSVH